MTGRASVAKTPLASTGWTSSTPSIAVDAGGEPGAIAFARAALRRQRSPSPSSASNWALRKRIFEASCMPCLRIRTRSSRARPGSRKTTASPTRPPFLVAAERDDVGADVDGERAERHAEGGGGVGEPGAVDVQEHPHAVRLVGERAQLLDACRRSRPRSTRRPRRPAAGCGARRRAAPPTARIGSGVELAVRASAVSSLTPAQRSGAPHSSTSMCGAVDADDGLVRARDGVDGEHVGRGAVEDREADAPRGRSGRGSGRRSAASTHPRRRSRRGRRWRARSPPAPPDGRPSGCRRRSRAGPRRSRRSRVQLEALAVHPAGRVGAEVGAARRRSARPG